VNEPNKELSPIRQILKEMKELSESGYQLEDQGDELSAEAAEMEYQDKLKEFLELSGPMKDVWSAIFLRSNE